MEHTPKISVIMSVYNGEAYLEEAIESVLSQTFSDFELIVIDDHSSDATPEILSRLAEKDAREEGHDEVIGGDVVEQGRLAIVGILNGLEQVVRVVGLPEVVLDVVVLRRDAEFDELVFECPRLLEETMHFAFDFHIAYCCILPLARSNR